MKLFRNFINFGKITVGALRTMIFNKNFSMTASGQKHYTTAMVNGLITRDTFNNAFITLKIDLKNKRGSGMLKELGWLHLKSGQFN